MSSSSSELRRHLEEPDTDMASHESELRRLAARPGQAVAALESIQYPVVSLPPEITSLIFLHYVHDPHIGSTFDPGRSPLPLASVCRKWRAICLSYRLLWSSLRIYPDYFADSGLENLLLLLERWFTRAATQPLDLQVFRGPPNTISTVFSFLCQYSHQWRTIHFEIWPAYLYSVPSRILTPLPVLTSLTIGGMWSSRDVHDFGEVDMWQAHLTLEDAPLLHHVEIDGESPQQILSLPWTQLTSLELYGHNLLVSLEILSHTTNLQSLRIRAVYGSEISHPPITLSQLRTFKSGLHYEDSRIFDYLTLPALESIVVTALGSELGLQRFRHLSVRSAWALRSIHLRLMRAKNAYLCLRMTPFVSEVEITYWMSDPYGCNPHELIEYLRIDSAFLPAVRTLTLRQVIVKVSPSLVAGMLAARWGGSLEGVTKLESFNIFFERKEVPYEALEEIQSAVRSLVDAGMDIVIGYSE